MTRTLSAGANDTPVLTLRGLDELDDTDPSTLTGKEIKFGATVTLVDEDTEEKAVYQIVGPDEADIAAKRLSISAPLARALIGKTVGDNVEVTTPAGSKSYEVVKVQFR